jgi:tetratricopeptide (TPR) repeat protein
MNKGLGVATLAFGLFSLGGSGSARAAEIVIGGGFAQGCHDAAIIAAELHRVADSAMQVCNLALTTQALRHHDLAATYANRGILSLSGNAYEAARRDFDTAIEIVPTLAGAYTNRGAALIGEGRASEGVAEIDRGLALDPPEPEKAYFNRAIGREAMGDLKGAYFDYLEASRLKPGWNDPVAELARFTVSPRR